MNERDAQGAAVRASVEEVGELADLLDRDDEARLLGAPGRGLSCPPPLLLRIRRRHLGDRLGLEAPEVRMVAGEVPAAGVAAVAGARLRIGVLAKEQLREALGERELADAARAVQQKGVRQALRALCSDSRIGWFQGCIRSPAAADLICSRTAGASTRGVDERACARGSALASREVGCCARARRRRGLRARSDRARGRPWRGAAAATSYGQSKTSVRSGARPGCAASVSRAIRSRGHALARALVGERGVGEAVADHAAGRPRAPGWMTRATWSARAAKMSSVSTIGVIGSARIAWRSRSARSVPPGSRVTTTCGALGAHRVGDELEVRRLAGAVDAFERDELHFGGVGRRAGTWSPRDCAPRSCARTGSMPSPRET